MALQLRTEDEGGLYHVINRGNYRQWVFEAQELLEILNTKINE